MRRRGEAGEDSLLVTDRTGQQSRAASGGAAGASGIGSVLHRVMAIRGAVDASLIDHTTGRVLARATGATDAPPVTYAADLVDAVLLATTYAPGLDTDSFEDIVVTTTDVYHLIRPVRTGADPRVVLYLRLDRSAGNLALARRSLAALGRGVG